MKRYSKEKIESLQTARREGKSIPQLMKEFDMPKTTIWHHVHNIKLDSSLLKKIRSRQGGSKSRSENDWKRAEIEADGILSDMILRELAVAGSMLYWAEGTKGALVFTNTDPDMLRLYLSFISTCLDIKKEECRLLIRIADPISSREASSYWSNELDIKLCNIKTDLDNKNNKTKTEFGICRVWSVKSGYQFKVLQCMISSLKKLS